MIIAIPQAVSRLAAGEWIAYPTETVYGLAVDASNHEALRQLAGLKNRAVDRPFSVLVADLEQLMRQVPELPAAARTLAQRFWPGPLTLVVPVPRDRFAHVASPHGVGFRCSAHPTACALAHASRCPLVSTSCNRSGESPCVDAAEVEACFGADLPIVAGEPAAGGVPSTVVAVESNGRLVLLREGGVPLSRLEEELAA